MCFINTVQPDIPIDPKRINLLSGTHLHSSMTFDEIMDITYSPYSDDKWAQLSYFVTKNALRPYYNEQIGRIADRKISNGDWQINKTSVNCLFYETYLRMPSVCDWTRHFLFFTPDDFLGSLGIYALNLSSDISEHMQLKQIAKVAQYQLISNSPFNRFMVAIEKENIWELAYGEIMPLITPKNYTNTRRVKISMFKEPSKFFYELLSGGKAGNVIYGEYSLSVRI